MGAILPLVFFAASFRKKEVPLDFYINEDTALLRRIARWAVDVVVTIALAWFGSRIMRPIRSTREMMKRSMAAVQRML